MQGTLLKRNSIILWSLKTYNPLRQFYCAALSDPQYAHLHFLRFRTPHETQQWLVSLPASSQDQVG
ncbi:hypothetical protein [Tengunoibacter tsumagoiensis]|uniref:Uncharacterized protein n=1 Tax=Tengunoibacter tsumagoiensis TaxID=2014871 RepID=A0A402A9E2_9CHLR|nr:hypothetical protein [Tengunoibacter tsumagoiensis]GCE15571.1 hypothetical protein KTT_54300 [Tengunoibacter tsumagoiensis]